MWILGIIMSAKNQYEEYQKQIKKHSDYVWAKILLQYPLPLTYEMWTDLHKIADGDME